MRNFHTARMMRSDQTHEGKCSPGLRGRALILCVLWLVPSSAAMAYAPIQPGAAAEPVTLTGHDLTVDQLIAVAQGGATVQISPEAKRHEDDTHGLLLEGAAEGLAVPGFNREGAKGETVVFDGDPTEPEIAAKLQQRALAAFQAGVKPDGAPEIADEALVRAIMVVRANTLTYTPVTTPVMQMLVDFLNSRITPIVSPPGATGPRPLAEIAAAMVGRGEVYYRGVRMPADQALSQAGLTPVAPADMDAAAFVTTDAYDIARAAIFVGDAGRALDWADLIFAMDLDGMDAGLGPLSLPAQANRPYQWLYWDATRVLDMLAGSYVYDQDANSGRDYPVPLMLSATRQGAAWRAWGALRTALLVALNSSDQTPVVRVALSPRDAPELTTPQMMRYFVKGGKLSGGKRGYIVPATNRDPYPLTNDLVAFVLSLNALDEALAARIGSAVPTDPVSGGGDIDIDRAARALDGVSGLLAIDLFDAAKLIDQRAGEDAGRHFGAAPTEAWTAFRAVVPAQMPQEAATPLIRQFLRANPVSAYYPKGEPPPGSDDPIPLAQERLRR